MIPMKEIVILAHNIRSTFNVGSLFRTAEGFGVKEIIFSGYTPYPTVKSDTRLPHIRDKLTHQISKTALGAESLVAFQYSENIESTIEKLKNQDFTVIALEQSPSSVKLPELDSTHLPNKIAVLIGEEIHGVTAELLNLCDYIIEIPMSGQKESFNVSTATGIIIYKLACEL
jgi:rRNA methylases